MGNKGPTEGTESTEKFEGLNRLTEPVIGAAIAVHRALGPGLLESCYETCLAYELIKRGFVIERQKPIPVIYEGITLDCGYRADLCIAGTLLVEVKAVEKLDAVHSAQILTYLKLSGFKAAPLINFNVSLLREGIRRFLNEF